MTVTLPSSGAPRSRPPRRLLARMVAALAVAVLVFAPWSAPTARAADPTPQPSPSPSLSGTVEAVLAPLRSGVVTPGEPLSAWVSLHNGTAIPVGPASVVLSLGSTPLSDRSALTSWLTGKGSAGSLAQIGTVSLETTTPGGLSQNLISIAADDPAILSRAAGVYPLRATFRSGSDTWTARSVMTVPRAGTTTPVGLVVPITAGPLTTGLLTADQLSTLTSAHGALTAELTAVTRSSSAILAIDPAVVASIRVLGSAAPESATAWLQSIMLLPNERFALQFGDADTALQMQTGHSALLTPLSLQSYMSPANFLPGRGADGQPGGESPSPTPTTAPDGPAYPDLAALLDIGPHQRGAVYWPFTGSAGEDDVAALGKLSVGEDAALTLIPSATTSAGAKGAAVTARGRSGSADVLVYDSQVSAALRAAAGDPEQVTNGAPLATAAAYLSFATRTAGSAPLLVVADRPAGGLARGLDAVISSVSRMPGTTPASLAELAASTPKAVTVAEGSAIPGRVIALGALEHDEQALNEFSSILDDPDVLNGPQRAEILQLLGGGWIGDTAGWTSAVSAHEEASTTTLGSVAIAPTSAVNLVGSAAPLRFWVRNDLPWPVNVELLSIPDDLRLEVQRSTSVVAQASSNTRVEVPVRAKIGNGEAALSLQLRSPTFVTIGQEQTVDVNVRADWEVAGLWIMGVLVGGFLVLGLVRTIVGRRRRNRALADGHGDASPGQGAS